jgi:hypothetical protein
VNVADSQFSIAMLGQKGLKIGFRDPNDPADAVGNQQSVVDPASHGPGDHLDQLGHFGNRIETIWTAGVRIVSAPVSLSI